MSVLMRDGQPDRSRDTKLLGVNENRKNVFTVQLTMSKISNPCQVDVQSAGCNDLTYTLAAQLDTKMVIVCAASIDAICSILP